MSIFLPHALRYAARGWRVIWAPPGSKHPTTKGWPDLATTDAGIIGRRWAEHPDANVCVATGQASGVWVLDVDDKNGAGGSATLAALERGHGGGGNKDLSNPHSRWSEALSAFLITSRTARLMKARG